MLRALRGHGDGRVSVSLNPGSSSARRSTRARRLFDEDMRFIEFSPYWNVPPSIVPRRDRARGSGAIQAIRSCWLRSLSDLTAASNAACRAQARCRAGRQMRIRQRPGPENALGDIKLWFFPNADNIYLQLTRRPSPVRARPARLQPRPHPGREAGRAGRVPVLQDMAGWDRARIEAEMAQAALHTLRLDDPVPVLDPL